jgi:hypothetical protein
MKAIALNPRHSLTPARLDGTNNVSGRPHYEEGDRVVFCDNNSEYGVSEWQTWATIVGVTRIASLANLQLLRVEYLDCVTGAKRSASVDERDVDPGPTVWSA